MAQLERVVRNGGVSITENKLAAKLRGTKSGVAVIPRHLLMPLFLSF